MGSDVAPAGGFTGLLVAMAAAIAALGVPSVWQPPLALVWNASASSPVGLYRVSPPDGVRTGDTVVAWPPRWARELGAARGYVPRNVPLVKRVAAVAGDRICASGAIVTVDGFAVARRREEDPAGRVMPRWSGCLRLRPGELFLLTPGMPEAFDGRYFGVTRSALVVGRARLLWSR